MNSGRRILVTGGSGRVGRPIIGDLVARSYEVLNVDLRPADFVETMVVDLTEPHQTAKIAGDFDAVVHLAGLPSLRNATPHEVFSTNAIAAHNVLEFAHERGIRKVVMASSEAVVGLANSYAPVRPLFLPIDETHPPLAQDAYGLSKVVQEQLAAGFARRRPELSVINLRFSWILDPGDCPQALATVRADPAKGVRKLFSYVDIRDACDAVRLAVECRLIGPDVFFIAAGDTLSDQNSAAVAAEFFPGVPILPDALPGHRSLIDGGRAARLIGYSPQYSCRPPDD
jgi:nucleoside-diphosphate-sugar epimerase